MANVSEVIPLVVDPNHERFGQVGEMIASDQDFGHCLIRFEDGEQVYLNDGWITGTPQFVAPTKDHEAGIRRLQSVLPDMHSRLAAYVVEIVEPVQSSVNKERNDAVRKAFVGLIRTVLFEPAQD
jgi:hypothetical protein